MNILVLLLGQDFRVRSLKASRVGWVFRADIILIHMKVPLFYCITILATKSTRHNDSQKSRLSGKGQTIQT